MALRCSLLFLITLLLPVIAFSSQKYVVQKGDNLYDLSRKFGVSVDDLKTENNLKDIRLDIGDVLLIPDTNNSNKSVSKSNNNEYLVKSGDTLSGIADKYGISTEALKRANGLKNSNLQIEQQLKIPSPLKPEDTAGAQNDEGPVKEAVAAPEHRPPEKKHEVSDIPTPGAYSEYKVKSGDTLGHIAQRYGVTSKTIKEINGLEGDKLSIGQSIKVPSRKVKKTGALVDKTGTKTLPSVYVVKKGDFPGKIAERLGVGTKDLIELNNLNSRSLQIGQKLKVPGSGTDEGSAAVTKDSADEVSLKSGRKEKNETEPDRNAKTSPEAPSEYTVKKGDSLFKISKKYNISVSDIKKRNNLRGSNLSIGQKLALGPSTSDAAESETTGNTSPSKMTGKYTVKKGDTLGHIALKFGISQKELKSANGLKSDTLRIAQVLLVPGFTDKEIALRTKSAGTKKTVARDKEPEPRNAAYVKKRYVVKSGDTLSAIANHFGVQAEEVKKASALKNDRINKGDILLIPVPHDYVATPERAAKYTVVTGDTLGGIGSKFGVTVSELKQANGLANNELWVGMKLKVPGKSSIQHTRTTPKTQAEYIVKRGDTLGAIAKRHGVTVNELKRANNLRSSNIRVGQSLRVPGTEKYAHSYSGDSQKPDYNSNSHYTQNGYHPNGYHSSNGLSPKYNIIRVAKKYLGAPYKFGGYSYKTGIDCSGYVKKVFSSFNVELPRTARDIYYRAGRKVAKNQLDTGDLVFFTTYAKFPSHVGIYIGDDQFIHASSAKKRVTIDSLNKRYYRNRYIGAKRVQVSGLFYDELTKEYKGFEEQ